MIQTLTPTKTSQEMWADRLKDLHRLLEDELDRRNPSASYVQDLKDSIKQAERYCIVKG